MNMVKEALVVQDKIVWDEKWIGKTKVNSEHKHLLFQLP